MATLGNGTSLVLMGLRGSGKSTVGRDLAERSGRRFIDLDDETRHYLGPGSLAEIIERVGLERFRQAEYRALVNQAFPMSAAGPIVALGGGTPTMPMAADYLRAARSRGFGRVIYLRAEPGTLRERLASADNRDRPSLTGAGVVEEIEHLFSERDPLYTSLADEVVTVDGLTLDDVSGALLPMVLDQESPDQSVLDADVQRE